MVDHHAETCADRHRAGEERQMSVAPGQSGGVVPFPVPGVTRVPVRKSILTWDFAWSGRRESNPHHQLGSAKTRFSSVASCLRRHAVSRRHVVVSVLIVSVDDPDRRRRVRLESACPGTL
jgi:hypothetical protein